MLKALHIKNYVLIDSLDIEFPAGLVIITGQTGAGKSILLGALSLVMGSRADSSVIGAAGDNCVVEAEFEVNDEDGSLRQYLDENEIDFDPVDGKGQLTIRRILNSNGRSRSFVNDSPAPLKVLSMLSSRLIDIHSQHETMLLRDKQFQMSMLDHFAGDSGLLQSCRTRWERLTGLKNDLDEVNANLSRTNAEKDYNQAQFERLDSAHLKDGELEELETEQKQLANAEEIKSSLYQVENYFSPSGDDAQDDRMSIDSMLKDSSRILDKLSSYIPSVSALSERIESARLELDDVLSEVSDLESGTEISDERLQEVEERLSLLYDLLKKYSCTQVSELIELRDRLSESLADTSVLEARKSALEKEIGDAEKDLADACSDLHDARAKAVPSFSENICNSIRSLELDRAVFDVVLEPGKPGPDGSDTILFRFSSTGKSPVDVAKCASGGEMSRIMLCLKAMMARYTNMPSMIFDEIDTGVSGSVADKMGSMICSMGDYMQVFAITHLPQVAAKGNAHYIVTKEFDGDRAISSIRKISGEDRVMEVARILSGSRVTPEAIANAKSLLGK
ncbi:MAG: DNA repair protein RecN [Bacteroidales bacterium]|nr:DNA repair protein RecN [Bacteroidales bacterium]